MPYKFQLKSAKNGKIYFNLLATNGEVTLTSQMYASKRSATKGIASVQGNASELEQFEEKKNKAGNHHFVLKAKNHQVIGNSEAYSGKAAMKKGINSVSKNAAKAKIEDLTD